MRAIYIILVALFTFTGYGQNPRLIGERWTPLETPPLNPKVDWIYLDTDGFFYRYNGTDWKVLVSDLPSIKVSKLQYTSLSAAQKKDIVFFVPDSTAASSGGGGTATNLSYTASPTNGIINSSTGTNATIPLSDATNAGLMGPGFYETGVFTPVLVDIGGGATYTSDASTFGKYTKIGNTVQYSVYLSGINTTGTPNSQLQIDGFPYTNVTGEISSSASVSIFSGGNINFYSVKAAMSSAETGSGNRKIYFSVQKNLDSAYEPLVSVSITNGFINVSGYYFVN